MASTAAPELTPVVDRLGGFDVIFGALDYWASDADVQLSAWKGLSDHSQNPTGAATIANRGGPGNGLTYLVEQLRANPEANFGVDKSGFSVKHAILQVINGCLTVDYSGAYAEGFLQAGLLDQVTSAMNVESELRPTVDVACWVLAGLLERDPSQASVFAQHGVIESIATAFDTFRDDDPRPWNGETFGHVYPVIPKCTIVLLHLARDHDSLEALMRVGMLEKLQAVRPEFKGGVGMLEMVLHEHSEL
mmetsp:Transcript_57809/g.130677  ORF Transcript_57809/g.130677 Transcript_57809/m.130677 type:complete len:248 (+) Transcript_57809:1-744(+)